MIDYPNPALIIPPEKPALIRPATPNLRTPFLGLTMMARTTFLRQKIAVAAGGITFVNSATGHNESGSDVTLSFSGLGLAENDVVIVGSAQDSDVSPIGAVSGYTTLANINVSGSNFVWVGYKRMGSTPDSSAVVAGTGNSIFGIASVAMIFRGVNQTTAIDVTTTTASGSSTNPDPGSIIPTSNNCAIVVMCGNNNIDASPGTITNYSTPVVATSDTSFDSTFAGCYRILSGGAGSSENPGAFPSWVTGAWGVATIALRPA